MKLDVNKNVTSRLSVQPIKDENGKYLFGGLVPVTLESITLETQEHKKGEFESFNVPLMRFEFKGIKLDNDEPDRWLTVSAKTVGTVQKNDETGELEISPEETVQIYQNKMWDIIKHILDNLTESPGFKNVSSISAEDIKKYFNLPEKGTPDKIIEKYEAFFKYLVDFVNDNKMTVDKNGKPLEFWIKVLPEYRERKYYTIPGYVNKGWIEPIGRDKSGKLLAAKRISIAPNESLELAMLGSDSPLPSDSNIGASAMSDDLKALMG